MIFGQHLMVDGYGCDKVSLGNKDLVERMMTEIARKECMTLLADPVVVEAQPNGKNDGGGWSGFTVIQESHISIHTFPDAGFVSIDVYTCHGDMDIGAILETLRLNFGFKDFEVHVQQRGSYYQP